MSTIQHCISVVSDEHLWRNLSLGNEVVSWDQDERRSDEKRKRDRRKRRREEKERDQELVLLFKIANGCLVGNDVFYCPVKKSHIYFPVFFHYPTVFFIVVLMV